MSILFLDDESVHLHDYRTSARRGAATTVTITLTIADPWHAARVTDDLRATEALQKAAGAARKAAEREASRPAKRRGALAKSAAPLLLTHQPGRGDD